MEHRNANVYEVDMALGLYIHCGAHQRTYAPLFDHFKMVCSGSSLDRLTTPHQIWSDCCNGWYYAPLRSKENRRQPTTIARSLRMSNCKEGHPQLHRNFIKSSTSNLMHSYLTITAESLAYKHELFPSNSSTYIPSIPQLFLQLYYGDINIQVLINYTLFVVKRNNNYTLWNRCKYPLVWTKNIYIRNQILYSSFI